MSIWYPYSVVSAPDHYVESEKKLYYVGEKYQRDKRPVFVKGKEPEGIVFSRHQTFESAVKAAMKAKPGSVVVADNTAGLIKGNRFAASNAPTTLWRAYDFTATNPGEKYDEYGRPIKKAKKPKAEKPAVEGLTPDQVDKIDDILSFTPTVGELDIKLGMRQSPDITAYAVVLDKRVNMPIGVWEVPADAPADTHISAQMAGRELEWAINKYLGQGRFAGKNPSSNPLTAAAGKTPRCQAGVLHRDAYRYSGGKAQFTLRYVTRQCKRKSIFGSEYCTQHLNASYVYSLPHPPRRYMEA